MFCGKCGTNCPDSTDFCPNCGNRLNTNSYSQSFGSYDQSDPFIQPSNSYGQDPFGQPNPYGQPAPVNRGYSNGAPSTPALVFGIIGFVFSMLTLLLFLISVAGISSNVSSYKYLTLYSNLSTYARMLGSAMIFGVLGIVFSAIGLGKGNKCYRLNGTLEGKARVGRNLAKAGLIISIIMTAIFLILLIIGIANGSSARSSYYSSYYDLW